MLALGSKAYGATIRLGGIVEPGSVKWEADHTKLQFRVAEGKEPGALAVQVASDQLPPQMFREGIGVVVEGSFDKSKVFQEFRHQKYRFYVELIDFGRISHAAQCEQGISAAGVRDIIICFTQ